MPKKKKELRFIEIYRSFSESEIREFREFISISLFNKGRNYNGILDKIQFKDDGTIELADSNISRTHWNRFSELFILAEKFLTIKNLEDNKFSGELLLLDELNKRDIINLYQQKFKAISKSTSSKNPSLNKINELLMMYNTFLKSKSAVNNFQLKSDSFFNSFNLSYLKFVIGILDFLINCFYIETSNIPRPLSYRDEFYKFQDLDRYIIYAKKFLPEYYPLVSYYYYVYKSLLNPDDTYYYYIARKILVNDFKDSSKEFSSALITYLIEYNVFKINRSGQTASKELFHFVNVKMKYKMLEDDLKQDYQNSGFISYTMNALALNKIKWAEIFVTKYGKYLPVQNRENGILLARAYIEYYRKNFDECKKYIDQICSYNPYSYVDSAKLNLRTCYELKKFEECFILLRRLQEYIRTQKNVSGIYISTAKHFCSAYILLLRLNNNPTKENLTKLEFLLNKNNLDGKKWIERKIKEINIL